MNFRPDSVEGKKALDMMPRGSELPLLANHVCAKRKPCFLWLAKQVSLPEGKLFQTVLISTPDGLMLNPNSSLNLATIGVVREMDKVAFTSFAKSDTYHNITEGGHVSINYFPKRNMVPIIKASLEGWNTGDDRETADINWEDEKVPG